jgi:hypothetical protein
MSSSTNRYWLLKAEPETRIVKGKDVKVGPIPEITQSLASEMPLIRTFIL